jgi:mannan endo-1,4-beta-mannosidase
MAPPRRHARRHPSRSAARAPLAALVLSAAACGAPPDLEAEAAACPAGPLLPLTSEGRPLLGLNAYYLQEEATRALRRGEDLSAAVEEVLGEAAAMGVDFVRTNAFNDDPSKAGDTAIQVAPQQYDETALRGLDLVLERARAHGLRLVLPLGNYWDAYGGARQYVAWAGLPGPRQGDPRFFTEAAVVGHYRAHVARLLDRVSTREGIRYGDHPAVLAWELLNEPRGDGLDPEGLQLRAWIDGLGALVKERAPAHLVGTGEEGLDGEGARFGLDTASPFVDYGSLHLYPEAWGVPPPAVPATGARLIAARVETARRLGKPLLMGEVGLRGDGPFSLADRRAILRGWLACLERAGGAGGAPWLFVPDQGPYRDPYAFGWLGGTSADDPGNQYVDVLVQTASSWRR